MGRSRRHRAPPSACVGGETDPIAPAGDPPPRRGRWADPPGINPHSPVDENARATTTPRRSEPSRPSLRSEASRSLPPGLMGWSSIRLAACQSSSGGRASRTRCCAASHEAGARSNAPGTLLTCVHWASQCPSRRRMWRCEGLPSPCHLVCVRRRLPLLFPLGADLWFQVRASRGSRVLLRTSMRRDLTRSHRECMEAAADAHAACSRARR